MAAIGLGSGALAIALTGCGVDELFVNVDGPDHPQVSVSNRNDGGTADAGPLLADGATRYLPDGALRDPKGGDGDGDGDGSGDGGVLGSLDGGLGDGGLVVVPPEDCEIDDQAVWSRVVPFSDEAGHALTPGGTGFGIAYRLDEGCDEVEASSVASVGPFPKAEPILGIEQCAAFRDLALLRDADRWLIAWVDNRTGSAELHHRHLAADMTSPSEITRVTDNTVGEQKPALTRIGATPILAWIEGNDTARGIHTLVLGSDAPREVVAPGGDHLPEKLALAVMGGDQAAALVWVNEQGNRGVWLQPLDAQAAAVGSPVELTAFASAGSTVDVATRTRGGDQNLGGATVYSVIADPINRDVRFRRLNQEGRPIETERILVGQPYRAQDASITELGDGYVVAYRALPDQVLVKSPEIRLLFVTREGTVERDAFGRALTYKVADATATQGRTTVRASVEGQLLISWLDFNPDSGENTLKMVRRRLDCAL